MQITNRYDSSCLWEGDAIDMRDAVQKAAKGGTSLRGANLQGAILWGAELRGADLRGDRVLLSDVGFPPVALQVRHGKSYPVWLLGDATELYAKAWEKKTAPRSGPGRPHGPWRLAYEIEREGAGIQWSK